MFTALGEPFSYDYLRLAALDLVLTSALCGPIGVLVVLRGLAYAAESVSHAMIAGAAVALVLGLPIGTGAVVLAAGGAVAIGWLSRRPSVDADIATTVVGGGLLAVGVIVLARGAPRDIESVLFGSILAVTPLDVALAGIAAVVAVAATLLLVRSQVAVAFDPAFSPLVTRHRALGDLALLAVLALGLTVALRGAGGLLAGAFLIAPATAARMMVARIWPMFVLAPAIGVVSSLVGLEVSYHARIAAGPAIALALVASVAIAVALRVVSGVAARPTRAWPIP